MVRPESILPVVVSAVLAFAAVPLQGQVTLDVVNNFSVARGGTYFGGSIENEDVSLYFTGTGVNGITYNSGNASVTATNQIRLSTVTSGSFSLPATLSGVRVYAILGDSAPATISPSGPDASTVAYPYSFIEFTTTSGGLGDQSFLNQVSFPTSLSNGTQTNSWSPAATAQSVATAFNTAFPAAPYAPFAGAAPGSGTPYKPYAATTVNRSAGIVQTPISGHRVVAASNVNNPNASPPPSPAGTGYTNVPGFNSYLGWLKDNQPAEGWKFGYDVAGFPNSTYVGFLKVTGTTENYGIELNNFTYGGSFSGGNITGGTSVTGTITYAPNNSKQTVFGVPDYTANWTDLAIFAARDPTGTAITPSGDLGTLDVASVLYTVSASIGPGILGSDAYVASGSNTDSFFKTGVTPSNILTDYFANSQFGGSTQLGFYDKYWDTMLQAGGVANGTYAGYFTPYDDHFSNLGVLMSTDSGTLTWELGTDTVAVPEPSVVPLLVVAGGSLAWRRLGGWRQRG
jgi:hypothetical protein